MVFFGLLTFLNDHRAAPVHSRSEVFSSLALDKGGSSYLRKTPSGIIDPFWCFLFILKKTKDERSGQTEVRSPERPSVQLVPQEV